MLVSCYLYFRDNWRCYIQKALEHEILSVDVIKVDFQSLCIADLNHPDSTIGKRNIFFIYPKTELKSQMLGWVYISFYHNKGFQYFFENQSRINASLKSLLGKLTCALIGISFQVICILFPFLFIYSTCALCDWQSSH